MTQIHSRPDSTRQLDAYTVALELARAVRPVVPDLARYERDLSSQLKRAVASMALNIAEAQRRTGADRAQLQVGPRQRRRSEGAHGGRRGARRRDRGGHGVTAGPRGPGVRDTLPAAAADRLNPDPGAGDPGARIAGSPDAGWPDSGTAAWGTHPAPHEKLKC